MEDKDIIKIKRDLVLIKKALAWIIRAMSSEIDGLADRNADILPDDVVSNIDLFLASSEELIQDLTYVKVFDED
jgi:hypothetical protein